MNPGWLLREVRAKRDAAPFDRDRLRHYQTATLIPFLAEHPRSAAFVDMGLGKTISVLTLLSDLLFAGEIGRVLIVAPKRVAIQTWPTEMAEWKHCAWMTHTLIRPDEDAAEVAAAMQAARDRENRLAFGSPAHAAGKARTAVFLAQRERAARTPNHIHIINREAVEWLVGYWGRKWPYDCVIIDESTSFSDHTTKRWKALTKIVRQLKRIHLLSGTPAPEGIGDLFAQCYLLDAGERFGRSITAFRQNYMMQDRYTRKWLPQLGGVEAVTAKMSDIAIVMKARDYMGDQAAIFEPLCIERPIVMERRELARYKAFERSMILEMADDVEIEAKNAGVLSRKLLQFASGFVYDEERKPHWIHRNKVDELHQLVEENPGEPLLVAYGFKPSLAILQREFPKATTMDRDGKCVADWNAGKIPMLFVHPQSAGHGLNMQLGPGHILVCYDTPEALELYLQIVARLARSGQRQLVKVIHLVTRGTLDALAVKKLRGKESAQDEITRYLREYRKSLRGAGAVL